MTLFPHPWLQGTEPLLCTEDKFHSPLVKQNELPNFPTTISPDIAGAVYVPAYAVSIPCYALIERKKFLVSDNNHLFVMAALFI